MGVKRNKSWDLKDFSPKCVSGDFEFSDTLTPQTSFHGFRLGDNNFLPPSPTLVSIFVRAGLHQASSSMLRQLSDDASDSVLIESNGITPELGCNPFSSNSIVFNENRIASVIAQLLLTLGVNEALHLVTLTTSLVTTSTQLYNE